MGIGANIVGESSGLLNMKFLLSVISARENIKFLELPRLTHII